MTVLFFIVLPLATILISIVLQKLLRNPILVALLVFAVYLILAFTVFTADFLINAIIYTIIAFITAVIVRIIMEYVQIAIIMMKMIYKKILRGYKIV